MRSEAADALTDAEQEDLVRLLRRRLAERGRQRLIRECQDADREHVAGHSRVVSVDDVMGVFEA